MKKKAILIFFFILSILGFIFILNYPTQKLTNIQKEQALTKILGRKPNLGDKNISTGNRQYKGKYISFLYPKRAKVYTQMLNGKPIKQTDLESFIFDLNDPKATVVVAVVAVGQNFKSVSDYPSVRLRQIENNIYSQDKIETDGYEGLAFTKQDIRGNEKTAFFYINSKIYSISVQGNDLIAIKDLFGKIIVSFKFLQP